MKAVTSGPTPTPAAATGVWPHSRRRRPRAATLHRGGGVTPTIEKVIDAIPAWAGRDVRAEAIVSGLTNRNWKVSVDDEAYFVRIPGEATELLAVDRANER